MTQKTHDILGQEIGVGDTIAVATSGSTIGTVNMTLGVVNTIAGESVSIKVLVSPGNTRKPGGLFNFDPASKKALVIGKSTDVAPFDLRGKGVIFTGRLKKYDRYSAEQKVKEHGGFTVATVNSNTVLVKANAASATNSKLVLAKRRGSTILTEDEFMKAIGE